MKHMVLILGILEENIKIVRRCMNKAIGFDQLNYVIDLIKNDPNGRRMLINREIQIRWQRPHYLRVYVNISFM